MMLREIAFILIFSMTACLFSCKSDQTGYAQEKEQAPADALFKTMSPEETGIRFSNDLSESYEHNALTNAYLYNGGGVGVIDFDHDGLEDLFCTSTEHVCRRFR